MINNQDISKIVGMYFALEGFLEDVRFEGNTDSYFSGKRISDGKEITFGVSGLYPSEDTWVSINGNFDYSIFVFKSSLNKENCFCLDNSKIKEPFIGVDELNSHNSLITKFFIDFELSK